MRLMIGNSKSNTTYHVIRDIKKNGKRSTEIVENLGSANEIKEKHGVKDAELWARMYIDKLNQDVKNNNHKVLIPLSTDILIPINLQKSFSVGYLFLQDIYYQLGLPAICKKISKNHSFSYNLDEILSRLVYGRILYPSSKLSCLEQSKKLIEQPCFELQQIYRALSVLSEESDFVQAQLYQNSKKVLKRSTGVLYYDCTNYFFETENEEGLKQYGVSKEHRPSPIVQMGLFMDKSGIPLAFCINKGNQNEQLSMTPLEKTIMQDFQLSKFVVCTDAGLSSNANRKFNNFGERSFITTQSIKKLKTNLKDWALSPTGWHLEGSKKEFNISELKDNEKNKKLTFFKQQLIEGYDEERDISFDQNLIITYSLKYGMYQKHIREKQISRALKLIDNPSKIDKFTSTDYKRLIKKTIITGVGEIADKKIYELNQDTINEEARYDGFYAVCTNLDDDPSEIARINHNRWEIEESFRIMKTEFKARPVFLKRDDRIEAHFLTCFISLLIYRVLEKTLNEVYTCDEIINTLRTMNVTKIGDSFTPAYTRTELTDSLHGLVDFRTDYELTTDKSMKGNIRRSKGL